MKFIVRVNKVLNTKSAVKAIVSLTIDDCIAVHGIKVIESQNGSLLIGMPNNKVRENEYRDIVHPINQETRKELCDAVINEYNAFLAALSAVESTKTEQII